jgi:hypothetical protein
MDMDSYEETRLPRDDWAKYLKEGAICSLLFYAGKVRECVWWWNRGAGRLKQWALAAGGLCQQLVQRTQLPSLTMAQPVNGVLRPFQGTE